MEIIMNDVTKIIFINATKIMCAHVCSSALRFSAAFV